MVCRQNEIVTASKVKKCYSFLALKTDCAQGGTKCAKRQMGFIDSEGSQRCIKAQNVSCFVAKLHLSRFTLFFRGNIPLL